MLQMVEFFFFLISTLRHLCVARTYLNAVRLLDSEHFAVLLGGSNSHHGVCCGLRSGTGEVVAMAQNSER